jgi:bla regulator protein blaR1
MISAVLAAITVALFGPVPVLLDRAQWPVHAPRSAVVLWQAVGLAGGVAAIATGLAVAVAPLRQPLPIGVSRMVARAVAGHPLAGLGLYEALGLTVALDVTVVLAGGLGVTAIRTLRCRARHRQLLDLVGTRSATLSGALVLDHAQPVAYCLPGLQTRIVVSTGALSALGSDEVAAVVSHEQGHAHARHDLVMLPFASMVDLLRWVPYVRLAPRAVGMLLEMAADDFASRTNGRRTVASALVHLADAGASPVPACAFGASEAAIIARVRRLLADKKGSHLTTLVGLAGAVGALSLPVATAVVPMLW